jgi:hypothetical protein
LRNKIKTKKTEIANRIANREHAAKQAKKFKNANKKSIFTTIKNKFIIKNKYSPQENTLRKMGVATRRMSVNSNNNPRSINTRRNSGATIASNPRMHSFNNVNNWK